MNTKLKQLLDTYLIPGAEIIIGADASKDNICIWIRDVNSQIGRLKSYWEDVRDIAEQYSDSKKYETLRIYANKDGLDALLYLKATYKIRAIGMEPTGLSYTAIFSHICDQEQIPIKWVGHIEIANYRRSHKLPNKNDLADAVAIGDYLITNWDSPEHFIEFAAKPIDRIREIYLQLGSLARIQSPIANRRSQMLANEFPEAAFKTSNQSPSDGISPLLAFLAGIERNTQRKNYYYQRLYADSIAPKYGIQISLFTRRLAQMNADIHLWEKELEHELQDFLNQPQFLKYNRAFDELGFGIRTRAIVLSQVYPVERFGRFNRLTGKFSYKKSLAAFKQRLGYGGEQADSGDKEQRKTSGSKLCRKALYLYVLDRIAPQKQRISTQAVQKLARFYDERINGFNYQQWVEAQARSSRLKLLTDLEIKLRDSMDPASFGLLAGELTRQRQQIKNEQIDITTLRQKPTLFESRKGYGSLTISHTAARAVRILFKLLIQD